MMRRAFSFLALLGCLAGCAQPRATPSGPPCPLYRGSSPEQPHG